VTLPVIRSAALNHPRISHAFFTRQGGVSKGIYATLNGGVGSRDDKEAVHENRRRMAETLGVAPDRLMIPFQIHSAMAIAVDEPWAADDQPHVDGVTTRAPGLALGVTGADCGVVLFSDAEGGVVGACHAGWKGALNDVLGATVAAMEELGAKRSRITAVLGPTIAQASYEVGPEFSERFLDADAAHARFFKPSSKEGYSFFDLPGLIGLRCRDSGVRHYEDLRLDTYTDEARFFSYRRTTHRGEPDYGRLVAAIALR
jgi:hypothetical protein